MKWKNKTGHYQYDMGCQPMVGKTELYEEANGEQIKWNDDELRPVLDFLIVDVVVAKRPGYFPVNQIAEEKVNDSTDYSG